MSEFVVAVFASGTTAEAAMRDLESAGIPAETIRRYRRETAQSQTTATTADAPTFSDGLHISKFWSFLIGEEPQGRDPAAKVPDRSSYERSLTEGGTVIGVPVADEHADRVIEILRSHGPIELQERPATDAETPAAAASSRPKTVSAAEPRARDNRVQRFRFDGTGEVW